MKILVIGAGVLGSLYAARLQDAGHSVTILARGKRLEEIQTNGLILENNQTGKQTITRVEAVASIDAERDDDLALILVRKNQLASVLPLLKDKPRIGAFVFMVNNCAGPAEMIAAVGADRVVPGFPGAGGERDGEIIRYQIVDGNTQPTTVGELDGSRSARVERIAQMFRDAGFPAAVHPQMDAWLKTHVALVSPVANALYLAGGDNYRLAHTRDGLVLMIRAIREGLAVLKALNIPVTPAKYRLLLALPEPLLVIILAKAFDTRSVELVMARHANSARDEMQILADEFKELALKSGRNTPAIDLLREYIAPETEALPENSSRIVLNWREVVPYAVAAGTALGVISLALFSKRKHGSK